MKNTQHIPSPEEVVAAAAANPNTAYGAALAAARPVLVREETTEDLIRRLETEQATVKLNLDAAADAAKGGDAAAAASYDLTALATRSAELQGQLTAARKVREDLAWDTTQQERTRQKQDFEQATEQARSARAEFRRAFASAAAALGAYCEATRQAIALNHQIRAGFAAPDPDRLIQLRDLENRAALSPLNDLLDNGYQTTMDYGYDLQITVPPLRAPAKKEGR